MVAEYSRQMMATELTYHEIQMTAIRNRYDTFRGTKNTWRFNNAIHAYNLLVWTERARVGAEAKPGEQEAIKKKAEVKKGNEAKVC